MYIYTTIKRHSYLFVAFAVGKWTQQTCSQMIGTFKDRIRGALKGAKMEIFTDRNDAPAMMEECANHIWNWHDFNYSAIAHLI